MTQKDFFRLISKLFGLYFIIQIIPIICNSILLLFNEDADTKLTIFICLIMISLSLAILALLLFKTELLIGLIPLKKHEKGQKNERTSLHNIIQYASNFLGLYFIADGIIFLFSNIYYNLSFYFDLNSYPQLTYQPIFVNFSQIILGGLLLFFSNGIANYIVKKNQTKQNVDA